MVRVISLPALVLSALLAGRLVAADAAPPADAKAAADAKGAAPVKLDEVYLKDGSTVYGVIKDMTGGKLKIQTSFAKEIEIDWAEVVAVIVNETVPVTLTGGDKLEGTVIRTPDGGMAVQTKDFANPVPISHDQVAGINSPIKPALTFTGFLAAGATVNDGNTRSRSATASGEFVARSERQRLTLRFLTNYGDDNDHNVTSQNTRGDIKYDFFFTKRFYAFADAFFEHDLFQDLSLRTALSAGPGYQFIDKGDFKANWVKEMQLSAEAGLAYFNENYYHSPDKSYLAARWAVNFLWPIVPEKIVIFHHHEGYPSLENAKDFYLITEQGIRFSIIKNFFASAQVNWRYTSRPPDDLKRSDTLYLFSLGYNFAF